jgi:hypothetical protein
LGADVCRLPEITQDKQFNPAARLFILFFVRFVVAMKGNAADGLFVKPLILKT